MSTRPSGRSSKSEPETDRLETENTQITDRLAPSIVIEKAKVVPIERLDLPAEDVFRLLRCQGASKSAPVWGAERCTTNSGELFLGWRRKFGVVGGALRACEGWAKVIACPDFAAQAESRSDGA